ncbi:MAG: drug/metabolite transporter (DMT)-like permease [Gammaproteobacteria bacterium]|jgi:drug/metabolite transporter (DMT)-like permease
MSDPQAKRTLLAACLMTGSMSAIAIIDSIAKQLAVRLHGVQVTWGYFLGMLLCLLVVVCVRGVPLRHLTHSHRPQWQLVRALCLMASLSLLFFSLRFLPLAEATTIGFTAPLFIVALAGPMLGEKAGARRWGAVLLGMLGAIIVMRPGMGLLHWSSLLALLGAFFFALFNVVTRKLGSTERSWTTLFYSFSIGVVLLSLVMPAVWVTPDLFEWSLFAVCGVLGLTAHFSLFRALTLADASVLAPLNYVRLIWAIGIGWFHFGDIPDTVTLVGGGITVASGLYVLTSVRRR